MSEKPTYPDSLMHGSQLADMRDDAILPVLSERRKRQMEKRRDIILLSLTLDLPFFERTRKMALIQTWILNGDLTEEEWNDVREIGKDRDA